MRTRPTLRLFPSGFGLLFLAVAAGVRAEEMPATLVVRADKPGASPVQVGVFFEDINFGADGGLYPERVKNGSFEFPDPYMGWKVASRGGAAGSPAVLDDKPLNEDNPHYLRLTVTEPGDGFGLVNEGYRGVGLKQGAKYAFSVTARAKGEAETPRLLVELQSAKGKRLASGELGGFTGEWKPYSCELEPSATEADGRIAIFAQGKGSLDLDLVSLFPRDTWQGRPRGLRTDLVQLLKDLHPGFMRFPGGCIVEGRFLGNRYQWKNTIGDPARRRLLLNRWNTEFKQRPAMDYYQSFGLGFFEYFQLCEDIGASPLPILNCGMACQYNSNELAPLDALEPYVQDALDLVEFANGPADSPWGSKRAEMGHPAPFHLEMMGVGNEQWGQQYIDRYERFSKAIKARYPQIRLVAAAGPSPSGKDFDFAWDHLRPLKADLIDEHYYANPGWFRENANRYDKYDRNGPKVFAGEYAAQSVGVGRVENRNDWNCALSEAAFMTGLVRNSDVVAMASYAPLFAHVDAWQWRPDLIWLDNLRSYGTPSYYVQQLFSVNRGTAVLPVELGGDVAGLYACATRDDATGDLIVKAVNVASEAHTVRVQLAGARGLTGAGEARVLACGDLKAENSFEAPAKVSPVTHSLYRLSNSFDQELEPNSVTVLRVRTSE